MCLLGWGNLLLFLTWLLSSWKDVRLYQLLFWHLLRWFPDVFPSFYLYNVCIDSFISFNVELTLHTLMINLKWSWCIVPFLCYWIQLANILLNIFTSTVIRDSDLNFSFHVMSLSSFSIRINTDLREWAEMCTLLIFGKSVKDWCSSNFWQNLPVNSLGLEFSLL